VLVLCMWAGAGMFCVMYFGELAVSNSGLYLKFAVLIPLIFSKVSWCALVD
jgi:hypothetical protein